MATDMGAAGTIAGGLAGDELAPLRALVFNDPEVRGALGHIEGPAAFASAAEQLARARGLDLTADAVASRLKPDPLALWRLQAPNQIAPQAPQAGWLPVEVGRDAAGYVIHWAWFGDHPLTDAFYESEMRWALGLLFNRLFHFQTRLEDLTHWAEGLPAIEPGGFIFHMSRCGSTLAAQMLAASPANVVVSEAAPIDAVIAIARGDPSLDGPALLRAMVTVFGHARDPDAERFFVKLDCWHTLARPLFRRAFPQTPWVFLYRDPLEVMVSQMRQRGSQMVPQFVPPSLYGIDLQSGVPDENYCARVLAAVCDGALRGHADHAGLMVNYQEMPEALFSRILPHFGVTPGEAEREAMARTARFDAKMAGFDFKPDADEKRRAASDKVRRATEAHLDGPYARLEALRTAQTT